MRSNDINILTFIFFLAQSYVGGVEEEEGGTPGQTRLSVATLLNRHEWFRAGNLAAFGRYGDAYTAKKETSLI